MKSHMCCVSRASLCLDLTHTALLSLSQRERGRTQNSTNFTLSKSYKERQYYCYTRLSFKGNIFTFRAPKAFTNSLLQIVWCRSSSFSKTMKVLWLSFLYSFFFTVFQLTFSQFFSKFVPANALNKYFNNRAFIIVEQVKEQLFPISVFPVPHDHVVP